MLLFTVDSLQNTCGVDYLCNVRIYSIILRAAFYNLLIVVSKKKKEKKHRVSRVQAK